MSNIVNGVMDFEVLTDYKKENADTYQVKIELENEVNAQVRDAALSFTGIIVRNAKYEIYGKFSEEKLQEIIKEKLNEWLAKYNFVAKNVKLSLKKTMNNIKK